MKSCPKCFDMNSDSATSCKQCKAPLTSPASGFSRTCPAGRHEMDPNWAVCAFCKAEGLVTDDLSSYAHDKFFGAASPPPSPRRTLYEGNEGAAVGPGGTNTDPLLHRGVSSRASAGTQLESAPYQVPPPPPMPGQGAGGFGSGAASAPPAYRPETEEIGRKTRVEFPDQAPTIERKPDNDGPAAPNAGPSASNLPVARAVLPTNYGGPGSVPYVAPVARPSSGAAPTEGRRIVGVLITYSWKADGQIFPVREGRNWIGRDPKADIVIAEDMTLSGVHTSITFHTRFTISDKDSMGGTFLNSVPVEVEKTLLPNYSKIRTGSTTWTFIAIEPGDVQVTP